MHLSLLSLYLTPSLAVTPLRGPDFDGDGYEDAAFSAPRKPLSGDTEDGAVFITYGGVDGLHHAPGRTDVLDLSVSGAGAPNRQNAHFGEALAWGDFNGDCFDDLVVSIPTPGGDRDKARVAVYLGSSTGPDPTQPLFLGPIPYTGDDYQFEAFGRAIAVGDFDADGRDDLVIGTPLHDGRVQVHYGGTGALSTQVFDETHPVLAAWDASFSTVINGAPIGGVESFGESFGTGDYNCDGHDDLVVGSLRGLVVIYGSASGLDGASTWPIEVLEVGETPGLSGSMSLRLVAMASGNFDGDEANGHACDDLAGVTYAMSTNASASILYGSPDRGLQATSPADDRLTVSSVGLQSPYGFAPAVAAGRFTSDAYDDLALATQTTGHVVVLRGTSTGITTSGVTRWNRGDELPGFGRSLGHGLGAGNYDGDDHAVHDLLLGTPEAVLSSLPRAGVAFQVRTGDTSVPTIEGVDAFIAEDLGSQAAAWDLLGAPSLAPRRTETCAAPPGGSLGLGSITFGGSGSD